MIGRPDQEEFDRPRYQMFVEGVLWIVRTGSPSHDLPEVFGDWNSVFRRFGGWSAKVSGAASLRQCPMILSSNT